MRKLTILFCLFFSIPCLAKQITVSGVVTETVSDGSSVPLSGVTVVVAGSTRGVITDEKGFFEIKASADDKLVFSFLGYEEQTVDIDGRSTVNVTMKSKSETMDAVTVVAFGRQKKESVIGSITTVNTKDIKVPSSNLTTALAGRVAGVIAYQRSGEPGQDNADFFIRGVTTFGYKQDPLILIDGMEASKTDLARLQPDDIGSFSIMKDATATALYGSRAANGVILITTKEGSEGQAQVNVRFENSFSMPTRTIELADPITYMRLHNESVLTRNPLGETLYSQRQIDNTIAGVNPYVYPATDWYDMLFKDYTVNQRVNVNMKGGGNVARYYVAGTFNQDNGVMKVDSRNNFNNNIDLKTYSLLTNVNINVTKSTKVTARLKGNFDDYTGPIYGGANMYRRVMRASPVLFPAYYPPSDGQGKTHILFGNYGEGKYINPYADLVKGYKEYSRAKMSAQFEIEQDFSQIITPGLSLNAMVNTNRESYFDVSRSYKPFWYQIGMYDRTSNTYTLSPINEDNGTEYLDYSEGEKEVFSVFYMQAALNYNRTFNKNHNLSGMLVYMMQNQLEGNASSLLLSLPYRNVGLSGRFTYAFADRYFTEFNFGYNGSERFYKTERWGFFPSVGVGWMVSNEKFMQPLSKQISRLKIRGSYGLTGNDQIGSASDRFFYLSDINMNDSGKGASFGWEQNDYRRNGVSVNRYENLNVTWEVSKKLNLAVELELFNSLEIIAEYFRERRESILMARADVPSTMGLQSTVKANLGKARGEGVDISLDYKKSFSPDFWLTARGNFTYSKSKYLEYEEPEYDERYLSRIGYPISQTWGYIAERLFIDDEDVRSSPVQGFGEYGAGDIKYRDVNGDGTITTLDRVPIGYPKTPEIVYGFGFSLGFKNWDLSAFFQGSARSSFWIDVENTAPFIDSDGSSSTVSQNQLLKAYADSFWSEDNRNIYALWPRLSSTLNDNNAQTSTWFMQDGSFLRLKQVELGYSLPQRLLSKLKMKQLRVYFSGTNLFTISKFKLWDVEMAGDGLGYPIQKIFNIGIQVGF